MRIWDPATGTEQAALHGHTLGVNAVCAFNRDGRTLLASGSDDRTMRVWSPSTTTAMLIVPVHNPVRAIDYSSEILVIAVTAGLLAIHTNSAVDE